MEQMNVFVGLFDLDGRRCSSYKNMKISYTLVPHCWSMWLGRGSSMIKDISFWSVGSCQIKLLRHIRDLSSFEVEFDDTVQEFHIYYVDNNPRRR